MTRNDIHRLTLGAILAATLGATTGAWAQAAAPGTDARMHSEMASCDGVRQDKAACLREAGAARQAARHNGLTTDGTAGNHTNAMARCDLQPMADRADCEARMKGAAGSTTTTSGSVMGGGVIRETVTPLPAR